MISSVEELVGSVQGRADTVMAVWDGNPISPAVGGVLILLEELAMLRQLCGAGRSVFCFLGEGKHPPGGGTDGFTRLEAGQDGISPVAEMVLHSAPADEVYHAPTWSGIDRLVASMGGTVRVWPGADDIAGGNYRYGTTLYVQGLFDRLGYLPALSCSPESKGWASRFFHEKCGDGVVVSLHLKNKAGAIGESNADLDGWARFLRSAVDSHGCDFVIVGNEPIPDEFRNTPGVIVAKDKGGCLYRDLAIIEGSSGFMGMASGLCQMAMFNERPYVIFKNPGHHPEEIELELGSADRFNFSVPGQSIKRIDDTFDSICAEFGGIYHRMASVSRRHLA